MKEQGIRFKQCSNAFLRCSDPEVLRQLSDSLLRYDVIACGQKWLAYLTPFFSERERRLAGCQHGIFFAHCDNLIFHRRAALGAMSDCLLDPNRTIGRPDKLTVIYGRRFGVRAQLRSQARA